MIEDLKPIEWYETNADDKHSSWVAKSALHDYHILYDHIDKQYAIFYYERISGERGTKRSKSPEELMMWAEAEHYPSKMAEWFNPDPLTEYAAKFTQWAKDRKIIQNGNLQTQTLKLVSEVGELADNIAKGRDTKDDIGDSFVVLNNLVEMQGYTWQECLEQAWNDIKDRKGHMNKNGVFIKSGDIDD